MRLRLFPPLLLARQREAARFRLFGHWLRSWRLAFSFFWIDLSLSSCLAAMGVCVLLLTALGFGGLSLLAGPRFGFFSLAVFLLIFLWHFAFVRGTARSVWLADSRPQSMAWQAERQELLASLSRLREACALSRAAHRIRIVSAPAAQQRKSRRI